MSTVSRGVLDPAPKEESGTVFLFGGKQSRKVGAMAEAPLSGVSARPDGSGVDSTLTASVNGAPVARDDLTGYTTRLGLKAAIISAIDGLGSAAEAAESEQPASGAPISGAYVLFAVDTIEVINECFGYDAGDEVITGVGRILEKELANADIGIDAGGGVIGRTAGNKFGMVLSRADRAQMVRLAEIVMAAVGATPIETAAGPVLTTISAGCVLITADLDAAQHALAYGEEALAHARARGSNTSAVFESQEHAQRKRERNREIADEFVSALNDQRLILAYQPIFDAENVKPAFYECLVRLQRENGEILTAGEFVPLAERLGLAHLLDHRVMEMTIETLRADPDVRLAMNVSGSTAVDGPILSALTAIGRSEPEIAQRLIIEITETVAIGDVEECSYFVRELSGLGFQIAIDDFGVGYTSFRYLQALGVDHLKIHGSFICGLAENPDNWHFVRALVDLAHSLKMETVAEWVSSDREIELLKSLGVDFLQGFHLGEPEIAPAWLTENRISHKAG